MLEASAFDLQGMKRPPARRVQDCDPQKGRPFFLSLDPVDGPLQRAEYLWRKDGVPFGPRCRFKGAPPLPVRHDEHRTSQPVGTAQTPYIRDERRRKNLGIPHHGQVDVSRQVSPDGGAGKKVRPSGQGPFHGLRAPPGMYLRRVATQKDLGDRLPLP